MPTMAAHPPDVAPGGGAPAPLRELIRSVYLERRSGALDVQVASEIRRFYFLEGELHLLDGHPLAQRLVSLLPAAVRLEATLDETKTGSGSAGLAAPVALSAAERQELAGLVERIGRFLVQLEKGDSRFLEGRAGFPEKLVGPLPTGLLVMEMAETEGEENVLAGRLGGLEGTLIAQLEGTALQDLYWLAPDEAFLLSRLEVATALGTFLAQIGKERLDTLRHLVRLRAIGLLRRGDESPAKRFTLARTQSAVVKKFEERLASELGLRPLELDVDEHRARLGELIATLGEKDCYELLGLRLDARIEQVQAAYEKLARLVHPSHARRLQLADKEQLLRFLFERATEAYLTLSDPKRRAAYDQRMGYSLLALDQEDPEERNRNLAREYYAMARRQVDTQQFHAAHQLLEDAARRDPRPEYLALLAQVQAKNPNWLGRSIESYRAAIELAPTSAELRLGLASTLEMAGRLDEARREFETVLARMPGHPLALAAVERLGGRTTPGAGGGGGGLLAFLKRLFGRG